MNEYAEVLGYYFCTSKSLAELQQELTLLAKRYSSNESIKVIYTDNPGSDESFLKNVFGASVLVKRDIFHVLNEYFKMCFKHPLRAYFMGDIRQCFFTDDLDDKLSVVEALLSNRYCMYTRFELMSKDDRWFRKRIRTYIIDKERIRSNLEDVMTRFSGFKDLFKNDMMKKHESVLNQLDAGYLTDPEDINVYFDVSHDGEMPKFITIRGTSQLESLHYHIQKILDGPNNNEETIHLTLTDRLFRWNLQKRESNRNQKYDNVLDIRLQKEIDELRLKFCFKQRYPSVHIASTSNEESFGILRVRFASESFVSSRDVVQQYAEEYMDINDFMDNTNNCLKKGIIRPARPISSSEEKDLYRILSQKNLDPKSLAVEWNALILDAIVNKRDWIVIRNEANGRQSRFRTESLSLKDGRHFELYDKHRKNIEEVLQLFESANDFNHFRAQRLQTQYKSHTTAATIPQQLLPKSTHQSLSQESNVFNVTNDNVVPNQSDPKPRKASKKCPECP